MSKAKQPRRPASVLVGGTTYTVTYLPNVEMPHEDLMGQTTQMDASILLNEAQSDSTLRTTFWHECLHAICQIHGSGRGELLHHYVKRGKRRQIVIEEAYVGFLEPGILQFVRDNPYAWAWILNTEAD